MKDNLYTYKGELVRIIDGDTIEAFIDLGFDTWTKRFIDVYGIDAPEIRTKDEREKEFGVHAKEELERLMTKTFYIQSKDYDSFGRSEAELYNEYGLNIGKELYKKGFIKKDKFAIKGHNVTLGSEK